jgi:guanylate kinase
MSAAGRLVILSGPSCAGKSPLRTALAKLYPELWDRLEKLVLFNSRTPRRVNAREWTTTSDLGPRSKRCD